jgi:hypothetical protein
MLQTTFEIYKPYLYNHFAMLYKYVLEGDISVYYFGTIHVRPIVYVFNFKFNLHTMIYCSLVPAPRQRIPDVTPSF